MSSWKFPPQYFFAIIFFLLIVCSTNSYATTYHIDKNGIGGACSDSGPGTLAQPWCSWAVKFWNDRQKLLPGDVLYIRGGVYYERFNFHPDSSFSGTSANPIIIRAYPDEKVVFDGTSTSGNGIQIYGDHSYINIIGPIEIRNFVACMETNRDVTNYGWVLDNINAHSCSRGLLIRNHDGFTLRNSEIHDTNGSGEAGGVFMSYGTTNVLIENVVSHSHNDGRGTDGDADGYWAHQSVGTVTMKNVTAYNNSEDGFDLKASNVTITDAKSYDNTTVGFKFWFGNYDVTNFLIYNNGEDGMKCSEANIDFKHIVSAGNNESGLQFRSVGCTGIIQNSIFANNAVSAVEFGRLDAGEAVTMNFGNNIFSHSGSTVINSCNATFYSSSEIEDGTFGADMKSGISCGSGFGAMSGGDVNSYSQNPLFNADYSLQAGSPAIDKGIFISGIHCSTADDDGVSPMNPAAACIHWNGASPDMGVFSMDLASPSPAPAAPILLNVK